MRKYLFTTAVILSGIFFSSCNKEDIVPDEQKIVGTWAVTAMTSSPAYDWDANGTTETNIFATYTACQRDIVVTFQSGGLGQIRQGCNANWENMNWSFSNSGRVLDILINSGSMSLEIFSFTDNTLRGEDRVNVNGNDIGIMYTFERR